MNREVIQDFLNLPGIAGVALTNRRMRPYFHGLNANLDERQQQALAQGILQVLENMPAGFDAFEFYFAGNVVFIYRLAHGLVLLVLTDQYLDIKTYRYGIAKVRRAVDADVYNAVATFKQLLGSASQTSIAWGNENLDRQVSENKTAAPAQVTTIQTEIKSSPATSEAAENFQPNQSNQPQSGHLADQSATIFAQGNADQKDDRPSSSPASQTSDQNNQPTIRQQVQGRKPATKPVSAKISPQTYKLDELLAAMNQLSTFTTQYLGKVVVKNYWRACQPPSIKWLQEFELDRHAQISHPLAATMACDPEQRSQIQAWVAAYIKRCKLVIRNFDSMIAQDCLNPEQANLLLSK
jgi:hypothetical protein